MKFSLIQKVFSITLSFLVLFSTLSLTIEKHFCGNVLVDVAIFSETEKCADDVAEMNASDNIKKSCCKDEVDVLEGINQFTNNSFKDLDALKKQVLLAYCFSYVNLFEGLSIHIIPHKDYSPPNLVKDIQLLDETYLI